MTKLPLAERLAQATPLLADGATGTLLQQRGGFKLNDCYDVVNLTHPDLDDLDFARRAFQRCPD